ncbi:MAG: hypothetical protein CTR53_14770 [Ferrovibrio sp.]|nr:MAG: hypothetical protein CTR53_14770 [Ferrovibrio sp.]
MIIGGAACELVFGEIGQGFRGTKDIDMVFCVEVVGADFAEQFRAFLEAGGYTARERSNGRKEFYRFHKPTTEGFPKMIEIFARKPGIIDFPEDMKIIRMEVEDGILSLSAMLLNDDYYNALAANGRVVNGLTVLDQGILVPFKAFAHINLLEARANGETVKNGDIEKHREDVFGLLGLLPTEGVVELPDALRNDLRKFIAAVEDAGYEPAAAIGVTQAEGIVILRRVYAL